MVLHYAIRGRTMLPSETDFVNRSVAGGRPPPRSAHPGAARGRRSTARGRSVIAAPTPATRFGATRFYCAPVKPSAGRARGGASPQFVCVSSRTSTAARHGVDCASHGSCHFRYLEPAILGDRGFRHGAAWSGA